MELEMQCSCSVVGAQEIADRRYRIFNAMNLSNTRDFTSAVIMSLAFDFQVEDFSIGADMWFGVRLVIPLIPSGIWAECDHPLDGLAVAWETLATMFPERVTANHLQLPRANPLVEAVRAFGAYTAASAELALHKAQHRHGPDPKCLGCEQLLYTSIDTYHQFDGLWGVNALNSAIDAAL